MYLGYRVALRKPILALPLISIEVLFGDFVTQRDHFHCPCDAMLISPLSFFPTKTTDISLNEYHGKWTDFLFPGLFLSGNGNVKVTFPPLVTLI